MNLKEIKELISLMNENDLGELEIEREGTKIRLKKSISGNFEAIAEDIAGRRTFQGVSPASNPSQTEEVKASNLIPIKAPMVGTFYRAPSPDAKPFVEIGQTVEVGQTVCIIEAMKLMNEIKSEVRGKLIEVLAENSNPIEYGQPLFMVEPV